MQYGITKRLIGHQNFLEISREDFDEAKAAHVCLGETLRIEETFNIILENYKEFEGELLSLCLNHAIFSGRTWSSFQNEIHIVNRRVLNLLTTSRLYVDQIPHNVNAIYRDNQKMALVKQKVSQEDDSNLGYRVIAALRNYTQHRGLPVFQLQYNDALRPDSSDHHLEHTITPSLCVSRLREEKKFKSSVLEELEGTGDLIDLKPLVRQYMESIGRIHLFIRELLTQDIAKWDSTVLELQNLFWERFGSDTSEDRGSIFSQDNVGLALVTRETNAEVVESVYIIEALIKRREWLVRKNNPLKRYNSAIISSESRPGDALDLQSDKRSK
jgi:hypothetical protein